MAMNKHKKDIYVMKCKVEVSKAPEVENRAH